MKKFYFSMFAMMMMALVCVGFTSCGSDDDDGVNGGGGSRDSAVIGTWYDTTHGNFTCAWRFDGNGMCYYYEWGNSKTNINLTDHPYGKWSTQNGILTISEEGYDDGEYYIDVEEYKYVLLEGGKTLELYEGNHKIYTLQKQ